SPIFLHDFLRPLRLADFAARQEAADDRLNVEHRRAVDGVEALNVQARALDSQQSAHGHANPVGPRAVPLREDAHLRPVRIATRMPRLLFRIRLRDAVEMKYDLDVRE